MTNEELLQIIEQAAREKVTVLDLSGKGLTTLPAEINQLSCLSLFKLSKNQLMVLPAEISELSNLSQLYLSYNQLTTFPKEISKLSNLSQLYLSYNQLTTLPPDIGQLSRLSRLKLSKNKLTTLPSEIGQLCYLSQLELVDNQLTTLPPEIGQLSRLNYLYLSSNQLTTLPPEIGQLSRLSHLYLIGNQLTTLPPEIGQLSRLSHLYLIGNQLTTLPPEIGQLSRLSHLYLRDNQLTTLPTQIGQLQHLETLDLENNNLINLPPEIQQLTQLKQLNLRGEGNTKLQIPTEVLGDLWEKLGEPAKILSYYFSLQAEPDKPLNEAKVLLVGQGSVGKTSLIKGLIENIYDPHECKTEGINVQNWQVIINHQPIRLNVWDFGGQEIMHATHQFFLTKRSLYLLVLDARLDERQNELEYWLKIIQSFGSDSPIIIVGNKIDQHPLDIDQKGLREKYTTIKDIVSVSCATGAGLQELRSVITRELAALKDIHDRLPKSWFQVKNCLEEKKESKIDYISYKQYQDLCNEEQVTSDRHQSTLIELLHRLGIILNFRDDDRLEDTNVLNPEWVTNGVYKILNDNQLLTIFRGILDREQLNRILYSACYPRNKQLFIVDMMQKFELCFPLEDGKCFLIPDLLPKGEPATGKWQNVLAFQYHYNVLPSSIISRFIVRMHHLADQQTWWRSGIVLKHRDNRALVKSDREDQKIFISISGNYSGRRELLAMIRSQFDAIHQTIKGLITQEKVPLLAHPQILVDYTHLLDLEELGETSFIPSGLKTKVSVQQLLDGIEPRTQRRERQHDDEYTDFDPSLITRQSPSILEKEIFISYTWQGESEEFVNNLDQVLQSKGITTVRDKRDLGYKGLIKEFMQRIGRGKCVITVISDRYLKSPNCMFELVQIAKNGNFYNRIFPIVLQDAKIYDPIDRADYIIHWEAKSRELETKIKQLSSTANVPSLQRSINEYTEIRATIDGLVDILQNMNTLTADIHSESGFTELQQAIIDRLDE
ncbi:COR domain-containing protein [Nostoc sp. TCL26-01]|uniref:COR domain-containing protein n=1 Tax=Nostoc sp. TCL26-01 TaxID=2576904 RepID=UPI0015BBBECF|nr:COR domain-containing protein [Nostoc sp. TCL26-01]QLE57927.1 GTP-binding protein [Nostoc sp. TCL26-01]